MWPSETTAIRIYNIANFVFIASLGVGLISTVLVIWMGNVKETYLKKDLALTNERAATLENSAAQAKLELEHIKKKVGPRQLNREAFLKALENQPKLPIQILYLRDDPDSFEFAQQIEGVLKEAKWEVQSRNPIPTPSTPRSEPTTMSVGGQPTGVTVSAHSLSEEEINAGMNRTLGKPWKKTPWTVLVFAFEQSMGESKASSHDSVPAGVLRVVVGPRP